MAEATKVNKSQTIRELLDKHKGKVTFGDVKAEMEKIGVTAGLFNVIKSKWGKGDEPTPGKKGRKAKTTPAAAASALDVSETEAIAFVREQGGLNAALSLIAAEEATLAKKRALVSKFQEVVALGSK